MNQTINRAAQLRDIERGKRELATLKPFWKREIVESIVERLFPDEEVGEVWQILNNYVGESEEVTSRIQLGALRLSQGSRQKLKESIQAATQDFREVILPAENPKASDLGFVGYVRLSDDEKDAVTNDDLNQYLDWIQKYYPT